MAQIRRSLPAFVGGEEKAYNITHTEREEAGGETTSLNLTGYTITAEIWWEGCRQISLSEGKGITIVDLSPPDPVEDEEPTAHYIVTLSEAQTICVPVGRDIAFLKLIRQSPEGVTTINAPIWLNRTA